MIVFKRQYIVVVIEVFFILLNGMTYTQADNFLQSVNREKRSDSTTIFKDQIFKRTEVLECTLTKSTIKSTSTLKTKVECAGLCLSMKNCNSFYWREAYTSCQILAKGDLCTSDKDSVVIYTKIDDLPPLCPSIVGPTHEFTTQFRSALGTLHSQLQASNFYITMNQSWYHNCNVNYEHEEEANIFCQSFHGFNYRPICYESGLYSHSGQLGNQMHSRSDCFELRINGRDIDRTNCNNKKCKIWETDLDFQGLYNIVCAAACDEGYTFVDGSCRETCYGGNDCCVGKKCKAGEGDCDGHDEECEDGIEKLEQDITRINLSEDIQFEKPSKTYQIKIPKFKIETSMELIETLKRLGVKDLFDSGRADLSGFSGSKGLYASALLQKAFIEVNEEGTEAAAATGMIVNSRSMQPKPPAFVCDHPFIFYIKDFKTGLILFTGRIMNPSEN